MLFECLSKDLDDENKMINSLFVSIYRRDKN